MLHFVQNVVLLHELRELVGREEFAHRRLKRAGIHEVHRKNRLGINHRHSVLDVALHARKADAHAALKKLARKSHATEAQVVDVIRLGGGIRIQLGDVLDDADDILKRERGYAELFLAGGQAETAVEVEAADAREIIAIRGQYRLHVFTCRFGRCDIPVAQTPIDLHICLFGRLRMVMCKSRLYRFERGILRASGKCAENLFFCRETQNTQKGSNGKPALAVYLHIHASVRIRFDLDPDAARRDYFRREITLSFIGNRFKENAV